MYVYSFLFYYQPTAHCLYTENVLKYPEFLISTTVHTVVDITVCFEWLGAAEEQSSVYTVHAAIIL